MTELEIRRNDLRGFHRDLQEIILQAINTYGVKYRRTSNGMLLYPPKSGHGSPLRINERNSDRQVKTARHWFVQNVIGLNEDGTPTSPLIADPEVIVENFERRAMATVIADETSPVTEPEDVWVPHVFKTGETSDRFETNGKQWRCKECLGTEREYVADHIRGLAGHVRTCHDETRSLYAPEAIAARVDTAKHNRIVNRVGDAIELLAGAIGYVGDRERVAELEGQVETLTARVAELEKECEASAEAEARALDAEARLALLREALDA